MSGDEKTPMDLGFALFNILPRDFKRAKAAFVRRWGQEAWDESRIEGLYKTGIMAMFDQRATKRRQWFVEIVAVFVNERYYK